MKNVKFLLIPLLTTLVCLTGCGGEDKPEPAPEKTNIEKAISLYNDFDIYKTNGYDYSLNQFLGETITNSHEIELKADFSGDVKGQKTEHLKELNSFDAETQFAESSETTYFYNNRIAKNDNGQWKWSNCKEKDFFNCNVGSKKISQDMFTNLKENSDSTYKLKGTLLESKYLEFLGIENFSGDEVSVSITVDSQFSKLMSFTISYFQSITFTEFIFEPFYGSVNINIPQ